MENENTSPASAEELEIANAFAEFAGEPAATKTPEEIAAEAAADATKTPEEIAAEAAAAAAAVVTKTPEEIAAEAAAAVVTAAVVTKTPEEIAAEADAAKTATAALAAKAPVDDPRIADLQAQIEALRPKEVPAAPALVYSADEQTVLDKYMGDWPDIAKGEALLRRAEYRELVAYVFQQVEQKYAPALDYVQNRGEHDQYSDIKALVPDYDDVRDKTLAWVDTQPAWLKAAYTKVANEGTAQEVAGLIGLYKKENNIAAPAAAVPATPVIPAAQAVPALAPAAKAAAAKLTVVKTGRSEAGTATEDTFESAFAGYAAEEDKRLSKK